MGGWSGQPRACQGQGLYSSYVKTVCVGAKGIWLVLLLSVSFKPTFLSQFEYDEDPLYPLNRTGAGVVRHNVPNITTAAAAVNA
jgi:hypothetical protein